MEALFWVAAAVVALHQIWTRGVVPMVKVIKAAVNTWDEIQLLAPIIRDIAEEFKPNGGDSLIDKVNLVQLTVNENQTALETRIATHDTYHESLEHRLGKLEE